MSSFLYFMPDNIKKERCAFHFTRESTTTCTQCKLPICDLDQYTNSKGERICAICLNIEKVGGLLKYFQSAMFLVIFGTFILLMALFGWTYIWVPLILFLIIPIALRYVVLYSYFRGISDKEVILPLLRYFEAFGNVEYYKLFLKKFKKLDSNDKEQVKEVLFSYLVPAIALGHSSLPDNWEEELLKTIGITKEEFYNIIEQNHRTTLVKIAVYNTRSDISKFIFNVAEITNRKEIIAEYIKELCNPSILELNDNDLNNIYKKTLEELFLYEGEFLRYCDELKLENEKECLKQLISRYEPPPVPKNQLEAVLTPEQLAEKRKKEQTQGLFKQETKKQE